MSKKTSKKITDNSSDYDQQNYNYNSSFYTKSINAIMPLIPNSIFKLYENIFCKYYFLKTMSTTFKVGDSQFKYFNHIYNHTWKNERRVEIPVIWEIIKDKNPDNILEVGNVLSHYYPVKHDILDKYEKGKSVINADIASYKTKKKYAYIVSISTLEHVGWDEAKKDKMKIIQTLKNLKTMLSRNGKIIFTVPLGYNPYLDEIIAHKKLHLDEQYFLKRTSGDNLWEELKLNKAGRIFYNKPYPNGNAIIVGIIHK